jgi:hypothetical protein
LCVILSQGIRSDFDDSIVVAKLEDVLPVEDVAHLASFIQEKEDINLEKFSLKKMTYQSPATINGLMRNCARVFRVLKRREEETKDD